MRARVALACLAIVGCHRGGAAGPIGTRLTGAVESAGDSIFTKLTIVNSLDRDRDVAFAPCPPRNTVKMTLLSGAAGAYHGSWDYATMDSVRQMRRDFTVPGCVPFSLVHRLPAGASVTSRFIAFRSIDVLGDSLPDGRYAVWLFPRIAGTDPAGVPAGEIELRRR